MPGRIRIERHGPRAEIVVDHPERRNAITSNMWRSLTEAALELQAQLGRSRVAARIRDLNGRLRNGLATMRGITLQTPIDPALAAGIVCFEVEGLRPAEAVARLRARRIVASESPYAVSYARVSAGIMVQDDEVERTLREIRALLPAA